MKSRMFMSIGILLSILPGTVHAAVSDHYVQAVIDRADEAIGAADGEEDPSFGLIQGQWLDAVSAAVMSLVDTDLRILEEERNVLAVTGCLDSDLVLLEEKIAEVQEKITEAQIAQKGTDIYRFQSVLDFLESRYRHLLRGARDPSYIDHTWGWLLENEREDESSWCCSVDTEAGACEQIPAAECEANGGFAAATLEACTEFGCGAPEEEDDEGASADRMCPFHSDYLPPTSQGFGCDGSVLAELSDLPAVAEYLALASLMAAREAEQERSDDRQTLRDDIETLIRESMQGARGPQLFISPSASDAQGATEDIEHQMRYGCGAREGGPSAPPQSSSSARPLWFAKENPALPDGAIAWELRGPFSVDINDSLTLLRLHDLRVAWGKRREQADYLQWPSEFTEEEWKTAREEQEYGIFQNGLRFALRIYFANESQEQGALESAILAKAVDDPSRMRDSVQVLRTPIREFATMVTAKDKGPRSFVSKFAYFLRRSCIYRPCNERLKTVLKTVFEDSCFPYVKGSSSYESCKEAAQKEDEE